MKIFIVLVVFESGLPYKDFLCVTKTKEDALNKIDVYFLTNKEFINDEWNIKDRNASMYSIYEVEI